MPERWYPRGGHYADMYPIDAGSVKLMGDPIPGWPTITKAEAKWREDRKQVNGKSAARPTVSGVDTSTEIGLEIVVITVEQMDAVNDILRPIAPRPGNGNQPISIEADEIEHLYIRDVVVKSVSAWQIRGRQRVVNVTFHPWIAAEKSKPAPAAGRSNRTAQRALPPDKRAQNAASRGNPVPSAQPAAASKGG